MIPTSQAAAHVPEAAVAVTAPEPTVIPTPEPAKPVGTATGASEPLVPPATEPAPMASSEPKPDQDVGALIDQKPPLILRREQLQAEFRKNATGDEDGEGEEDEGEFKNELDAEDDQGMGGGKKPRGKAKAKATAKAKAKAKAKVKEAAAKGKRPARPKRRPKQRFMQQRLNRREMGRRGMGRRGSQPLRRELGVLPVLPLPADMCLKFRPKPSVSMPSSPCSWRTWPPFCGGKAHSRIYDWGSYSLKCFLLLEKVVYMDTLLGTLSLIPGVPMVSQLQDPFFTHCMQMFRASDATTFDEYKRIAEQQVDGFLLRDDVRTHP